MYHSVILEKEFFLFLFLDFHSGTWTALGALSFFLFIIEDSYSMFNIVCVCVYVEWTSKCRMMTGKMN